MKELQTSVDWKNVLEQSKETPIFVMKHSTTCPISAVAYQEFDRYTTEIQKYYVKVQDSRPVSDEIASDLGIRHESPQLFLLKDGDAVWQSSHYDISKSKINKALENYKEI